jgi:hypothetical protein
MDENNVVSFGIENQDLNELRKSLEVGYAMGTTDQTGFGATRLESLEKTLKMAVEKEKTSKFWISLKKSKANSTVEEFSSLTQIGSANFYVEGGIPEEYDEELKREFELVKFVGTVGRVPNVAQSVKSLTNNMSLVKEAKAVAMIRTLDIKSFFGNADNISTEFNGFIPQFYKRVKNVSQNVIDLRGKKLTPEVLSQVGEIIENNYGDPHNIQGWLGVSAFRNYAEGLIKNKQFFVGNNEIRDITSVPKTFEVGNGAGRLETDLHLKHKGETYLDAPHPKLNSNGSAFASTHAKAPATLSSGTASVSVDSDATTQLDAGTYDYCIVPINKYGAGAGFELKGNVVASSKKCTFTLADNGSVAGQEASAFEIYRKLASATALSDYRYLKTVTVSGTKVDNGSEIPNTTIAPFFDWDFDQVLDFKQLLPMVAMDLAIIDDSKRWLQKLYGTPILYNANKMVLIKNIGTGEWS